MNLSLDPLVVRSHFIQSLPNDPSMRFKFNEKLITVYITDPEKIKLIPSSFEDCVVRVICITEH